MSALFIITLALLAAIAYTIYRRQQTYTRGGRELEPVEGRGLFVEDGAAAPPVALPAQTDSNRDAERAALLARAVGGDHETLADARRLGDPEFYRTVLGALVAASGSSPEKLQALAAFVCANSELSSSVELSKAYRRMWEQKPDAISTARALHLSALSDEAAEFGKAVEAAGRLRREGRLPTLGAAELNTLIESEYWLMSPASRASGSGFVVKQILAALRAELMAAGD